MKKIRKKDIVWTVVIILCAFLIYDMTFNYVDWQTANRNSANMAPKPEETDDAVVQVYVARVYNWR